MPSTPEQKGGATKGGEKEGKAEKEIKEKFAKEPTWQDRRAFISAWLKEMKGKIPDLKERAKKARALFGNIPEVEMALAEAAQAEKSSAEKEKEAKKYSDGLKDSQPDMSDREKLAKQVLRAPKGAGEVLGEYASQGMPDDEKVADALADQQADQSISGEVTKDEHLKGVISRVYEAVYYKEGGTVGEALGWTNTTSDTSKVNDIELLLASCFDVDFVKQHHQVRNLLEAQAIVSKGGPNPAQIFAMLERRSKGGKLTEEEEMIVEYTRLFKMKRYNKHLGAGLDGWLSDNALEEKFKKIIDEMNKEEYRKLSKEERYRKLPKEMRLIRQLEVEKNGVRKKVEVDLWDVCQAEDVGKFDFKRYSNGIENYQIGLQILGGLRDEAIQGKHSENAGHSQFFALETPGPDGRPMKRWLPVSATMAEQYVDADVRKRGVRERTGSHVHELGAYNEEYSLMVKIRADLLTHRRKDLTETRDFSTTNPRMKKTELGLGSGETAQITEEETPKGKMPVFWLGGKNMSGNIYKALGTTYDEAMKRHRGYGVTKEEARELYINDVLGPFLSVNPYDWNMCLASVIGSQVQYTPSEAAKLDDWSGKKGGSGFCVAIDRPNGEPEYFYSLDELLSEVNRRITDNKIDRVKETVSLKKKIITASEGDSSEPAEEAGKI